MNIAAQSAAASRGLTPWRIIPLGANDDMIEMCAIYDDGTYLTTLSFKFPRPEIVSAEFDKCIVDLNKSMTSLMLVAAPERPSWTTCLGESAKGVKLRKLLPSKAS